MSVCLQACSIEAQTRVEESSAVFDQHRTVSAVSLISISDTLVILDSLCWQARQLEYLMKTENKMNL